MKSLIDMEMKDIYLLVRGFQAFWKESMEYFTKLLGKFSLYNDYFVLSLIGLWLEELGRSDLQVLVLQVRFVESYFLSVDEA